MLRFKDRPFEILAVSIDDIRQAVINLMTTMNPPGIQTWDEKGSENPIARLYNVQRLPTWFLLDEKGVIRARDPFGEKLIPALHSLLESPESAATSAHRPHSERAGDVP